jgi:hypothetical protein
VSSRRFQPAENFEMRITSTPTGLTSGPAPPGRIWFFWPRFRGLHPRLLTVCPFGATPRPHLVLIGDFE